MIRALIREIRIRRAHRKLASLVAKRKAELERREYAKHRAAGKLGWQHRRTA